MSDNNTFIFPATNTFKENVKLWAERHDAMIELGHGLFFDFKAAPEFEKPVLDYLIKHFSWIFEKPFFIRKPISH
ncbi:MAG: hypothetical protein JKY70_14070 [Mucilaginibacter sp.]|nr:hypothetical protein [Mucilaginibacter sp.]